METKKPAAQGAAPEENDLFQKVKNNKKGIIGICVAVVVIAIITITWSLISASNASKADEAVAKADVEALAPVLFGSMPNDSLALALYQQAAEMGHKSGARAALHAAIMLYDKGEYKDAIEYLKKGSSKSSIIEAGRLCLMGDCYANLKDYDQAVASFKKAYSAGDHNPELCPLILVKEANIYREQGKYKDELNAYETVINQYPAYYQNLIRNARVDLRKYAERAKASAETK